MTNDGKTQAEIASKVKLDEKTVRKWQKSGIPPSGMQRKRKGRTRRNPFAGYFPPPAGLLAEHLELEAKTLFQELQRQNPGVFSDNQLRTFQRRFKELKATEGGPREVFFPQVHFPGDLCASDFTRVSGVGVTIQKQKFAHLLYHFVLTYSNWEHVSICPSESWESLSYGLQMALQALGGVPLKHRSDSLSAAVNNLKDVKEFSKRYQALLLHYGLGGQKTNPRSPNENGDAEQGHHRLKKDLEQALILRGSRDFASEAEYREFLDTLIAKRNATRQEKLAEEKAKLRPLPATLFELSSRFQSRVSRNSTIRIKNNSYSVPSRLIGEQVIVRLYADRLEVFYGDKREETIPRLLGRDGHKIQYRHIIEGLLRKPGAFMQYVYREDLYPSVVYRQAYDAWQEQLPGIAGVKQYLRTLKLAADEGEQLVEELLLRFLLSGQPFQAADLLAEISKTTQNPSSVIALFERQVEMPQLDEYNQLLSEACV